MKPATKKEFIVRISHLNERGYGVGTTEEGKEIWSLNTLPQELVRAETFKKKRDLYYARAVEIIEPSPDRIAPREPDHFLACSPWQMMTFAKELDIKREMITGFFRDNGVELAQLEVVSDNTEFEYRNKVEFGFYSFDDGRLTLSYFKREGSRGKYSIDGCELLPKKVNQLAAQVIEILNDHHVDARSLKGLLIRYSWYEDKVVTALFTKSQELVLPWNSVFETITDLDWVKSFSVNYSFEKSPANIVTEVLFSSGEAVLSEKIGDTVLTYGIDSFFQVNPRMFARVINEIKAYVTNHMSNSAELTLLDFYSGVGTIGIMLQDCFGQIIGVESGLGTKVLAEKNAADNNVSKAEFYEDLAENLVEYVTSDRILLVDPPRNGLHQNVINRICEVLPPYIIYVSCNPLTQAKDIGQIAEHYTIDYTKAFNFYPRTPHCENVVILKKK